MATGFVEIKVKSKKKKKRKQEEFNDVELEKLILASLSGQDKSLNFFEEKLNFFTSFPSFNLLILFGFQIKLSDYIMILRVIIILPPFFILQVSVIDN